jgi:hypothetical protein
MSMLDAVCCCVVGVLIQASRTESSRADLMLAGGAVRPPDALAGDGLPGRLADTGLYRPGSSTTIDPRNLEYVPQYPLWSDGGSKRRWIRLPEGQPIDAGNPDRWRFPVGTRFWKEFSFSSRTETRYIERRADGSFRYGTYVWNLDNTDAELAPTRGIRGLRPIGGGLRHDIPSQTDCLVCHEERGGVLGFGALQLSPDRDPLAPHRESLPAGVVDLGVLSRRGLLRAFPSGLLQTPPRVAARTPRERAALGYLFGNCANCHNSDGPLASLGLDFDVSVLPTGGTARGTLSTSVGRASRYRIHDATYSLRIAAGRPEDSTIAFRMRSQEGAARMPPLATQQQDSEGVQLIERWIREDLVTF